MKIVALLLAVFAFARAEHPAFVVPSALAVRGGSVEIGPLDGEMALKLAKTATMAYAAGAGSKYISSATGGASSNLADFVTSDLFALNALATAVACALFKLGDTGFDSLKVLAVMNVVSLVLKMDKGGFNADTIMANKAQTVITLLASVLAFA